MRNADKFGRKGLRGIVAAVVFILLIAAGVAFGHESAPIQEESARIGPGSELALILGHKKRARIQTSSGIMVVDRPLVLREGIASGISGKMADLPGLIPWDEVIKVQIRKNSAVKGAVIGASVGGALGLMIGLASMRECTGWIDFFCGADAGDVLLATAFCAATIGMTGGLFGLLFRRWATVYSKSGKISVLPEFSLSPAPMGGLVLRISFQL